VPSAGDPSAVDGNTTSSHDADVDDCNDAALTIGRSALASIRSLGATAWVVLEALVLDATLDDGALVTCASARAVAGAVSVSRDTAAAALRRLADAGLIERRPQHRTGGRFGAGAYVLHLPPGLVTTSRRPTAPPPAPTPPGDRPRSRRPAPSPQRHDQLTLLDVPEGPQP
jgi:hypothetical protein